MNYKEGRKNNCAWAYLLHYEKLPRIYIFIGCKGRINTLFNISAMIFMGVDKNKCIRSRINIREKEVQSIGKGLIWEKIWTVSPFVISSFMNRLKYITYSSWSPLFEQSNSFDSIRFDCIHSRVDWLVDLFLSPRSGHFKPHKTTRNLDSHFFAISEELQSLAGRAQTIIRKVAWKNKENLWRNRVRHNPIDSFSHNHLHLTMRNVNKFKTNRDEASEKMRTRLLLRLYSINK